MMQLRIKDWTSRLQHKGGARVGEGVWANWELSPEPGTACHAPGFIQPRFKEP